MKKANTKIFLTIILIFIIILTFLYFFNNNNQNNTIQKNCVLYKATSQNYTYQNLDSKKHVARFEILQNKDNLSIQFYPNFVITQPGETKNYWIEAYTNKKINESEITYLIKVNNYPLQTIKTKLKFECIQYENITKNNTNNNTNNTNNSTNYTQTFYTGLKTGIKTTTIIFTTIIILVFLIIILYFLIKAGRKQTEKKEKNRKETKEEKNTKKEKLEKLLETRIKVKKGLTLYQKIIIFLFIILIIILAIIAIQNSSFDLNMFTTTINTTNITK